jgi:hypothetical protein
MNAVRTDHRDPVIFTRTVRVPWDDLDEQGCGVDGAPDWTTLIVTGPTRRRDAHGNVSLEWSVTAQCRPAVGPREGDQFTTTGRTK